MNFLRKILQFRVLFWIILCFTVLLFAVVVWAMQPSAIIAVLSGLILLLVFFLIYFLHLYLEITRSRQFIHGLEYQTQSEMDSVNLITQKSIQELRQKWNDALAQLKRSNVGRGRDPLYHLPWFIMMGEPQSGKSTAIRQSGAEFPIGNAIQGTGGTRNCDWWFSDRFIILDTAGRYTVEINQETDQKEWLAFLKMLAKYRKRLPVNGTIISIPIDSIIKKNPEQIRQDARRARAKIDQITQELGVKVPVYVLVTKCDLINGFVEFFDRFPDEKREEALGWTNDQSQLQDPATVFDAFFDRMNERFERYRTAILRESMTREVLHPAIVFPEEFRQVQVRLKDWIEVVFQPNPYFPAPFMRGIYLTSGTQVGTVITSIMDKLGFPTRLKTFGSEKESRSYFLRDFFNQILVRDRNLVAKSKFRIKKERRALRLIYAIGGTILALFIIAMSGSFFLNMHTLGSLSRSVTNVRYLKPTKQAEYHLNNRLFNISSEIERLRRLTIFHPSRILGFYLGADATNRLTSFFLKRFYQQTLDPTLNSLTHKFQDSGPQELKPVNYQSMITEFLLYIKYLNTLRAELVDRGVYKPVPVEEEKKLLPDSTGKLPSDSETITPKKPGKKELTKGLVKEASGLTSKVRDFFRERDSNVLGPKDYRALIGLWGPKLPLSAAKELEINVNRYLKWQKTGILDSQFQERRGYLDITWLRKVFNVYALTVWISSTGEEDVELSPSFKEGQVLSDRGKVPAVFTRKVFNDKIKPLIEILTRLSRNTNLDLSLRKAIWERVTLPLIREYTTKYKEAWLSYLFDVRVIQERFLTVNSRELHRWMMSAAFLEPILQLADNTTFTELKTDPIYSSFLEEVKLYNLVHKFKEQENIYRTQIQRLSEEISRVRSIPDGNARYNKIKAVFSQKEEEQKDAPARELALWVDKFLADTSNLDLRNQMEMLLKLPLRVHTSLLLQDASVYLQNVWEQSLSPIFDRQFSHRFPFGFHRTVPSDTVRDVDPNVFTDFFKPGSGTLHRFLNIAFPFVTWEKGRFVPGSWNGLSIHMGLNSLKFLNECQMLTNFFFDQNGEPRKHTITLKAEISRVVDVGIKPVKPLYVTGNHMSIRCDEEQYGTLKYYDGPPVKKSWRWAIGSCDRAALEVWISRGGEKEEVMAIGFTGSWALLKLLRSAERKTGNMLIWVFPITEDFSKGFVGKVIIPYYLLVESRNDPLYLPFVSIACPRRISE